MHNHTLTFVFLTRNWTEFFLTKVDWKGMRGIEPCYCDEDICVPLFIYIWICIWVDWKGMRGIEPCYHDGDICVCFLIYIWVDWKGMRGIEPYYCGMDICVPLLIYIGIYIRVD